MGKGQMGGRNQRLMGGKGGNPRQSLCQTGRGCGWGRGGHSYTIENIHEKSINAIRRVSNTLILVQLRETLVFLFSSSSRKLVK